MRVVCAGASHSVRYLDLDVPVAIGLAMCMYLATRVLLANTCLVSINILLSRYLITRSFRFITEVSVGEPTSRKTLNSNYMACSLQSSRLHHPAALASGTSYQVPSCEAPSTLNPHPFWTDTLAAITLSLHSSLNVRDHASQPYSTTGNIIVLYILIFKFLERSLEDKSVWSE